MKKYLLAASIAAIFSVNPTSASEMIGVGTDTSSSVKVESNRVTDVIMANPELSTLVSALRAANWIEPLKGAGPYTLFAPNNTAFAALPAGTFEDLLKPENKAKLQNLLKHHIVTAKYSAVHLKIGSVDAKTMNGTDLKIIKDKSGITVSGAKITQADIGASNGVVQIIDKVIVE